jgi:steroid delta-isomerase
MASDAMRSVVSMYFSAFHTKDAERWVACFAPDAVSHEPAAPVPLQGHAALRQFFQGLGGTFKSIELSQDHVFVRGNRVAVKFTGRGTGTNGRAVTMEGIDVFEFNDNGMIQTLWGYWDPAAMMAQLQG